jgi:hypothetical protein
MLYGNRRRFDRRVTSTAIPATTRKSSRWVAVFTASSSAAASVVAERIGVAARMSWRAKRGADELNRDARGGFNRPDSRRRFKSGCVHYPNEPTRRAKFAPYLLIRNLLI